jgi:hypothetical protein
MGVALQQMGGNQAKYGTKPPHKKRFHGRETERGGEGEGRELKGGKNRDEREREIRKEHTVVVVCVVDGVVVVVGVSV